MKIDSTYPNNQFKLDGFNLYRQDRRKGGGGIMAFFSSSLLTKRLQPPRKYDTFESLIIKSKLCNYDVTVLGLYRPPKAVCGLCQFFEKRGYPVSVVKASHHHAQQFDRQSALQTSQKDKNDRIPFTLTFHPHNHAVKSIILNNFKISKMIPRLVESFRNLVSFKRDKNIGIFLVRSALKTIKRANRYFQMLALTMQNLSFHS